MKRGAALLGMPKGVFVEHGDSSAVFFGGRREYPKSSK